MRKFNFRALKKKIVFSTVFALFNLNIFDLYINKKKVSKEFFLNLDNCLMRKRFFSFTVKRLLVNQEVLIDYNRKKR